MTDAAPGGAEGVRTADVRKTMLWLTLGTVVYLGAQWLLTVVVFQLAGPAANGDYTLALSASSVAYAVVLFGMRPFQISDTRGEYADAVYLASRAATSLLAVAAFAVTLPFTAGVGRLWPLLAVFLAFRLTEGWMDVLHGLLQNADRMDRAGIALLLRASAELAVFGGVLAASGSLLGAAVAMLAVSALVLGLEWRWARPHLDGVRLASAGGWRRAWGLLLRCAPLLAANLAYSAMLFVPRNAIQAIWGQELLGYYGAIAAPLLLVPVLVSYLYTPFLPALAEHQLSGRPGALAALAGKLLGGIAALIAVAFALLPFVGPPVLGVMFGRSVLAHLDLLWPVAASVAATALVYFGNAVLTATRRIGVTMIAAIVAFAIVAASSDFLVHTFGPNGASFALIVGQLAQAVVLAAGFLVGLRTRGGRGKVVG